jgi:hypothetical protein
MTKGLMSCFFHHSNTPLLQEGFQELLATFKSTFYFNVLSNKTQ